MANLKVLDGNAVAKYLSTNGTGTDADPHVSHHVLDANTDGVYIGDIKFGESLLAGANAIGKLAANSGVDIGDVTINNASGASAVNIQDGGNTITVDGTIAATQSGTWNVGTVTTVTGVTTISTLTTITNPVAIKNAAADTVTGVSGTYDTIDVSLTNGTYRATIDSSGYLTANINGTITVDGSVTADTELPTAATLSDTLANPTAPMIGAALLGYDNTNSQWERLRTNDSGVLRVVGNGTAGSADAAVVTVQGIASATPVIVTGDAAGSLTIDNAALAVVGGGAESTALRVTIANDSTGLISVDDGGGTLTIDGSVTADTELPAAGALGDAMNNPTTPLLGACLMGWDSAAGKWERCKTDASNYLKVDASVATVTVTGDATGSLTVDQATHDSFNCNANLQQGDTDVASNNELYVRGSGTAGSPDAAILTIQGVGSMTPVIVTGDSAGSLTVDQATATNLKATVYGAGSAGSADAGVMTIQGISSMTPILATLQTSDGTDIGNVDVASVVPGTGASNLGKAEDATHTSGDVGVMILGVRKDDVGSLVGADGDYVPLLINEHGILRTQAQQHFHIDEMNATSGWTVLGTDTVNLATTTNHVFNTLALEFDKVDGAANTVFAGIQKTLSSTDLAPYGKGGGFFLWSIYLSSLTDVAYVFLRLGTDSSNYNEWRIDDDELATGWNPLRMGIFGPAVVVANGWDTTAVTYVALGVAFDDEADELADLAADHLSVNTGLQTSADIVAEVSSSVRTPNVNILKVGNKSVDIGTGNAGVGTMRVVLASDQPVLSIDDNASSLSIDIGGQAPQLDDTDKIAVSLYGKGTSAGDDAVETDGSGNLQVVGTGTAGSAAGGILTVQGVASMTPILATLQASDGTDIGDVTINNAANAGVYVREGTSASWNIRALTNADVVSVEQSTAANLNCTEASASNILTAVQLIDDPVAVLGTATYTETTTSAFVIGAVRNDTLATLVNTDNEIAPLQVDASGALYVNLSGEGIDMNVEGAAAENANAAGNPVLVGGRYDATPRSLDDTDVGAIALDADGAVHIADGGNTITVDGSLTVDLGGNNDVTTTLTTQTMSSLDHGSNLDIDTTAEQITATSFAAKHGVLVKADAANSGIVYIGNSDVTAGDTAATDGIPLSAGEAITTEIDNPNKLYAIGSAVNQKVYWMAI